MTKGTLYKNWFPDKIKAQLHMVMLGLFFFVFFHYTENNSGGLGLEIPNNDVAWIMISMIIGLGFLQITRSENFVYSSLTIWLFVCVCLLSVPTLFPWSRLFNESPVHLGMLGGLLFYIAIQQFKPGLKELNTILVMVLVAALIESLMGWSNYFGINWRDLSMQGLAYDIPYGAIRQRNSLSTLFVTALLLSAWFVDPDNRKGLPEYFRKSINYLLILTPILLVPLIYILKSRTGWFAVTGSLLLILPCLYKLRHEKIIYAWLIAMFIGSMINPVINTFSDKPEVVPESKLHLSGPRTFFYEQVIDLALQKPILGHGYGNFEKEYTRFSAVGYANGDYESPAYVNLSHPHNEVIYWWIEGGILGLAGVLLAAFIVVKNIFQTRNVQKILWMLALIFPIVLHTQTEIPFYSTASQWFIFLILILLIDVHVNKVEEKNIHLTLLTGLLALLIPLLVTVFMITTIQSGRLLTLIEKDMGVEVSILEEITNPVVWQDRLMWDMNFGLLALAVYQDRPELAVNYIEWATEVVKRKPRAGYYQFLVVAYQVIGDEEQVKSTRAEAEFLFPEREFNIDISVFRNIENKNISDIQTNMIAE